MNTRIEASYHHQGGTEFEKVDEILEVIKLTVNTIRQRDGYIEAQVWLGRDLHRIEDAITEYKKTFE